MRVFLGRSHPAKFLFLLMQVAMNNAVLIVLAWTWYLLDEFARNDDKPESWTAPPFPYRENPEFNQKLQKVILWTSILYCFTVPIGLIIGHFFGYFLCREKSKIDIVKFPLVMASIPLNLQYLMIPILGGFANR